MTRLPLFVRLGGFWMRPRLRREEITFARLRHMQAARLDDLGIDLFDLHLATEPSIEPEKTGEAHLPARLKEST